MSKLLSNYFVAFIAFCFLLSCKNNTSKVINEEKGTLNVQVVHSAGDIYESFNDVGVPTFFNIATVDSESDVGINSIVLGKKISKGIKLSVHPVALLSFNQDTLTHKFIVTVDPANSKIDYEYNSFLLKNYEMQATIENWFRSQSLKNECFNFKWENVYKALLEVN